VAGIDLDIDEIDAFAMRDQVAPVGAFGEFNGAVTTLKSMEPSAIGENEQLVAAVGDRNCTPCSRAATSRGGESGSRDRSAAARRFFVIATGDHADRPLELS